MFKTLWQMEKLLVLSNFSFCQNMKVWLLKKVENIVAKGEIARLERFLFLSEYEGLITEKSWKHCGKRRNCSSWAISPFVRIFSKSRLLQKRQKVYLWGKGLILEIVSECLMSSCTISQTLICKMCFLKDEFNRNIVAEDNLTCLI